METTDTRAARPWLHLAPAAGSPAWTSRHPVTGTGLATLEERLLVAGHPYGFAPTAARLVLAPGLRWRAVTALGVYAGHYSEDPRQRNLKLHFDERAGARLLARLGANLRACAGADLALESWARPLVQLHFDAAYGTLTGRIQLYATARGARGRVPLRYTGNLLGSFARDPARPGG